MKRALKKRVKAVLENTPSDDAPVEQLNTVNQPLINRQVRTRAAMIGLAISMGATSLLVTQQSDQAQAAAPVGSQNAASTIPVAPNTKVKFAPTNLRVQKTVSSLSVPDNPVIVEPTAISQLRRLAAKRQSVASRTSEQVPKTVVVPKVTTPNQNAIDPKPQLPREMSIPSVNASVPTANKLGETILPFSSADGNAGSQTTSLTAQPPQMVASVGTSSDEVNAQLKAQQEFALNRLQQKSDRLRASLAQLRSAQTQDLSASATTFAESNTVQEQSPQTSASNPVTQNSENIADANRANLVSRLQQTNVARQAQIPAPSSAQKTVASSIPTGDEIKPGATPETSDRALGTSVLEIVKSYNLTNPHELEISPKLNVPPVQNTNTATQTTVAINPTAQEFNSVPKVVVPTVNPAAVTPQLPPVGVNNQVQAKTESTSVNPSVNTAVTPAPAPIAGNSYGMGGDNPVPQAVADMQLARTPEDARVRSSRSRYAHSLRQEIEKLQERYRAQQSGGVVVSAVSQTNNAVSAVPQTNNAVVPISVPTPNQQAVQIPVPKPNMPDYSPQLPKPEFRAAQPTTEIVNPEFTSNNTDNKPSNRVATPPVGVNASDSLGSLRGTTVSPKLPPLAAVDRYLPRMVDPKPNESNPNETTQPPSLTPSSTTAYIWPAKGVLTSGYGWRWGRMHKGIDIANSIGTPIYASSDGVVEKAGWNKGGYGNVVDIRHTDGSLTRYGHNSKVLVQPGQQVRQGETIALMGSSGHSTGPHSHFEIHPTGKQAVNPIAHLPPRV